MSDTIDLRLYFNFRSPYCYLASERMFELFDQYQVNLLWRPLEDGTVARIRTGQRSRCLSPGRTWHAGHVGLACL